MQSYLQLEDDGLPMRKAGKWAAEKLDYLARYIDVFETSMRDKWQIRYYVDLLAGPGKNRVRDSGAILLGSPLLALTTRYPFTAYFFVDSSSENTNALRQRCTASPDCQRVDIRTGDCNELVNEIVVRIKSEDWRSLNLAFLDPEGMELEWKTVATLASLRRMELIINYPEGGLNRLMPKAVEAEAQTGVDSFFGGWEWRAIYEDWLRRGKRSGIHRQLIDLYKRKLGDLGYKEIRQGDQQVESEPLIRSTRRAPLYRLLFASKHPLGHEFWQKVTRRNVHGQRQLRFVA